MLSRSDEPDQAAFPEAPCHPGSMRCQGARAGEDLCVTEGVAEEAGLARHVLLHAPLLAGDRAGSNPASPQLDPQLCWPQSPTVSCLLLSQAGDGCSPKLNPDGAGYVPWPLKGEGSPVPLALLDRHSIGEHHPPTGSPSHSALQPTNVTPGCTLRARHSSAAQPQAEAQGCLAIADHELGQQEAAALLEACAGGSCPPGRRRRRRAASAEPQPKRRRRAAHTNPLSSLRSSGNGSPIGCSQPRQGSGSLPSGGADFIRFQEEKPSAMSSRGRRGAATVSGVSGLLRSMQPGVTQGRRPDMQAETPAVAGAPQHAPPADLHDVPTSPEDPQGAQARGAQADVEQAGRCQAAGQLLAALHIASLAAVPARRGKRREPRTAAGRTQAQAVGVLGNRSTTAAEPASGNAASLLPVPAAWPLVPVGSPGAAAAAVEGAAPAPTEPDQALGGEAALAKLLRGWTNPVPAPQRPVPDLAALACGNTLGLVPRAVTRDLLDVARPLQQVHRSLALLVCMCTHVA